MMKKFNMVMERIFVKSVMVFCYVCLGYGVFTVCMAIKNLIKYIVTGG